MFVAAVLFIFLSLAAAGIGGAPEKILSAVISTWIITDQTYHAFYGKMNFSNLDHAHLVLDGVLFVTFALVMLKANRCWPIIATGAQAVVLLGHLSIVVSPSGVQRAYWAMTQLPSLIVIASLIVGALGHRNRLRKIGPYRQWSY
ncbi:MAG: hypothetical protein WA957_08175 [Alteraurantiacibacter sp.]